MREEKREAAKKAEREGMSEAGGGKGCGDQLDADSATRRYAP